MCYFTGKVEFVPDILWMIVNTESHQLSETEWIVLLVLKLKKSK